MNTKNREIKTLFKTRCKWGRDRGTGKESPKDKCRKAPIVVSNMS